MFWNIMSWKLWCSGLGYQLWCRSCILLWIWILAVLVPIQLRAKVPEKTVGDRSDMWLLLLTWETPMKFFVPGFSQAQAWLLLPFGGGECSGRRKLCFSLSPFISFCPSALQLHKEIINNRNYDSVIKWNPHLKQYSLAGFTVYDTWLSLGVFCISLCESGSFTEIIGPYCHGAVRQVVHSTL